MKSQAHNIACEIAGLIIQPLKPQVPQQQSQCTDSNELIEAE